MHTDILPISQIVSKGNQLITLFDIAPNIHFRYLKMSHFHNVVFDYAVCADEFEKKLSCDSFEYCHYIANGWSIQFRLDIFIPTHIFIRDTQRERDSFYNCMHLDIACIWIRVNKSHVHREDVYSYFVSKNFIVSRIWIWLRIAFGWGVRAGANVSAQVQTSSTNQMHRVARTERIQLYLFDHIFIAWVYRCNTLLCAKAKCVSLLTVNSKHSKKMQKLNK